MTEEHTTIKFKIIRRTSAYNKYIKWFRECYREDKTLLSSSGYRTRKEAENFGLLDKMPIGNRIVITHYIEEGNK